MLLQFIVVVVVKCVFPKKEKLKEYEMKVSACFSLQEAQNEKKKMK